MVRRAEREGGDERGIGRQQTGDGVALGASAQRAPGASSNESGGRIVTIRFASIVFPEPGGPTRARYVQNDCFVGRLASLRAAELMLWLVDSNMLIRLHYRPDPPHSLIRQLLLHVAGARGVLERLLRPNHGERWQREDLRKMAANLMLGSVANSPVGEPLSAPRRTSAPYHRHQRRRLLRQHQRRPHRGGPEPDRCTGRCSPPRRQPDRLHRSARIASRSQGGSVDVVRSAAAGHAAGSSGGGGGSVWPWHSPPVHWKLPVAATPCCVLRVLRG